MPGFQDFADQHLTVRSRQSSELLCLCPYHEETNPSFRFNVDTGLHICFACGERGGPARLFREFGFSGPGGSGRQVDTDEHEGLALLGEQLTELEARDTETKCSCAGVYSRAGGGWVQGSTESTQGPRSPRVNTRKSPRVRTPTAFDLDPKGFDFRGPVRDPSLDFDCGSTDSLDSSSTTDSDSSGKPHLSSVGTSAGINTTGTEPGRCRHCGRPLVLDEKYLNRFTPLTPSRGSVRGNGSRDAHICQMITHYWVNVRGIHPAVVERFQLGYSPMRRSLVIPYRNIDSLLLGTVHRHLAGRPKYRYPLGFPRRESLFGIWAVADLKLWSEDLAGQGLELREGILPEHWVVLTEGSVDSLAVWSAGLPSVAMWGSFLHQRQIQLLHDAGVHGVVVFTDRDSTGRMARRQSCELLSRAGFMVRRVSYPSGYPSAYKDPGAMPPGLILTRVAHSRWHWADRHWADRRDKGM